MYTYMSIDICKLCKLPKDWFESQTRSVWIRASWVISSHRDGRRINKQRQDTGRFYATLTNLAQCMRWAETTQ